jgi:hypothetical protein
MAAAQIQSAPRPDAVEGVDGRAYWLAIAFI